MLYRCRPRSYEAGARCFIVCPLTYPILLAVILSALHFGRKSYIVSIMPSTPPVACRIFVILAKEAPVGVIFRRGPSKWMQIIKWHTDSDTFDFGAWFHGQIYPERCDLSPDGTKLIYFATDYSYSEKDKDSKFPTAWTAISKVPWLTALCVWPNGGTYYGGGLFETDTKLWINQWHGWGEGYLLDGYALPEDLEVSYDHPFWDHDWHTLFRLECAGWKPLQPYPTGSIPLFRCQPDGSVTVEPTDPNCPLDIPSYIRTVHEKSNAEGSHSLIMTSIYAHYSGNSQTFDLRNNKRQTVISLSDAVWADWDKQGRLLFAGQGKLFAMEVRYAGALRAEAVADFNSSRPKRTKSPQWAREW